MKLARAFLLALAFTLFAAASTAEAQRGARDGTVGVGGMVGDPTGLSMKFRIGKSFAIDLGVGWKAAWLSDFQAHVDFLWGFDLHQARRAMMLLYVGVGPKLGAWGHGARWHKDHDGFFAGVRVPIGLDWEFLQRRLDVFVELAPGVVFTPDIVFYPDAAAGARFWF